MSGIEEARATIEQLIGEHRRLATLVDRFGSAFWSCSHGSVSLAISSKLTSGKKNASCFPVISPTSG